MPSAIISPVLSCCGQCGRRPFFTSLLLFFSYFNILIFCYVFLLLSQRPVQPTNQGGSRTTFQMFRFPSICPSTHPSSYNKVFFYRSFQKSLFPSRKKHPQENPHLQIQYPVISDISYQLSEKLESKSSSFMASQKVKEQRLGRIQTFYLSPARERK